MEANATLYQNKSIYFKNETKAQYEEFIEHYRFFVLGDRNQFLDAIANGEFDFTGLHPKRKTVLTQRILCLMNYKETVRAIEYGLLPEDPFLIDKSLTDELQFNKINIEDQQELIQKIVLLQAHGIPLEGKVASSKRLFRLDESMESEVKVLESSIRLGLDEVSNYLLNGKVQIKEESVQKALNQNLKFSILTNQYGQALKMLRLLSTHAVEPSKEVVANSISELPGDSPLYQYLVTIN